MELNKKRRRKSPQTDLERFIAISQTMVRNVDELQRLLLLNLHKKVNNQKVQDQLKDCRLFGQMYVKAIALYSKSLENVQ